MTRTINAVITGRGSVEYEVTPDMTLTDLARIHGLDGFDFNVDNLPVDRSAWSHTKLWDKHDLWGSTAMKGAR